MIGDVFIFFLYQVWLVNVFNLPTIIASTSVYHFSIIQTLLQQELSKTANDAACKYNEDTSIEDHTSKGIAKTMPAACRKQHKQHLSEFVKHVCVACFPKALVYDNRLHKWLDKAAFYARVSVVAYHNLNDVFILWSLLFCLIFIIRFCVHKVWDSIAIGGGNHHRV